MDESLCTSTSSSTVSKQSTKRHITIASKLHDINRRVKHARKIINEEGALKYGGCTNERVGPPIFIKEPYRTFWRQDIQKCANRCVWYYLLPAYLQKVQYYQTKVKEDIIDNITEENRDTIEWGIKLGRDRIDRKWDRREGKITGLQRDKEGSFREEEIGIIKRGETKLVEGEILVINNNIKQNKDVFKIISYAIYGSGRFAKLIIRNLWKYINLHEDKEREAFQPFLGKLTNNTDKWIHTWSMFSAFMKNRDLVITAYELDIIGRLYDVQINIYQEAQGEFKCIRRSGYITSREVNLLKINIADWLYLNKEVKVEKCATDNIANSSPVDKLSMCLRNEDLLIIEDSKQIVNKKQVCNRLTQTALRDTSKTFEAMTEPEVLEKDQEKSTTDNTVEPSKLDTHRESIEGGLNKKKKGDGERNMKKKIFWQKWRRKIRDIKRNREKKKEELIRKEKNKANNRQLVFDFTTDKLSPAEVEFLSKGESFCIANHKVDKDRLKTDIFNYGRKLRLHDEFREPKIDNQSTNTGIASTTQTQANNTNNRVTNSNGISTSIQANRVINNTNNRLPPITQTQTGGSNNIPITTSTPVRITNIRSKSNNITLGRQRTNRVATITQTQIGGNRAIVGSRLSTITQTQVSNRSDRSMMNNTAAYKTRDRLSTNRVPNITQTRIGRNIANLDNRLSTITQTQPDNRGNSSILNNRLSTITRTQGISSNIVRTSNRAIPSSTSNARMLQQQITSQVNTQNNRLYNDKDKIRKLTSTYDPDSQNRNLNRYIQCIQEESLLIVKKKAEFNDNITTQLREAMKSLIDKIDNKRIIITKADKGSGLVAVDYDTYMKKGTNYIEVEAKAYTEVRDSEKDILRKLIKTRNNIVHDLKEKKVIEIETATYCIKQLEEKITGLKFYYKIHKDSNITTMPLRPLQSCINAPTHHLSQVLTDILQPFLKDRYIPTYLQDSNQLLYRLGKLQPLGPEDTLISSDVAALYPSIPHQEGMIAMTEFLQYNTTFAEEQINSIVKALQLVISENYIVWNEKYYKQNSGVAMGTPVAVAYANIFMSWVDEEIRQKAPFIIKHYRYIDDNLFILPKDRIADLMSIANNILNPQIRFTYETLDRQSEVGLSFLDNLLFIAEDGKIESRLYTKKTDKHAYLLPTSYHPLHITKNIPQAVFNRIRRLCSKDEWYHADAGLAIEWLKNRGYNHKVIKQAAERSGRKDRNILINNIEENRDKHKDTQGTQDTYKIPFLVTYGHPTQRIKEVLHQRKGLLDASFSTTKVKPRLTFRRQKNISDIIVQKGLRGPITSNVDIILKLCGEKPRYRIVCPCKGNHDQKICRCCAHMKLQVEGIKVKLYKQVDCDTKNVIYLIGCKICSKKYIGETQQKLKDRLLQHLNNITKLKQPLYTHFNQVHKAENLFITVIETVKSEEPGYRKVREAWWINRLQTLEPRGFNVKLECQQIYLANSQTLRMERTNSMQNRR